MSAEVVGHCLCPCLAQLPIPGIIARRVAMPSDSDGASTAIVRDLDNSVESDIRGRADLNAGLMKIDCCAKRLGECTLAQC